MLYIKLIIWLYPFVKEIFDNDKNLIFKFKKAFYNTIFVGLLIVSVTSNFYLVNSLFSVSSNYRDLSEKTKDYTAIKSSLDYFKRANNELDYKLKNLKNRQLAETPEQQKTELVNCTNQKKRTRRHTIHAISDQIY